MARRSSPRARRARTAVVLLAVAVALQTALPVLGSAKTFSGHSQVSIENGGEVFLKGRYIEVGMHNAGSFGTRNLPPSGLGFNGKSHAGRAWSYGIGFIADYNKDGFNTGSPTKYSGDYFLPGSPLEGWSVEYNIGSGGKNTYINKGMVGKHQFDSSPTVEDTSDAGKLSAVWIGEHNNMKISKVTSFGENDLYFVTTVTIKNQHASLDFNDVYYMRNVDPDQEQPWTGDYSTDNYVKFQRGDRPAADMPNEALVVAKGTDHPELVLGLGTVHPTAHVTHYGFQNNVACCGSNSGWENSIWKDYTEANPRRRDEGINLVFKFDKIVAGASVTFSWAYVLEESDLVKAMQSIDGLRITAPSDSVSGEEAIFSVEVLGQPSDIEKVEFFIASATTTHNLGSKTVHSAETDGGERTVWSQNFNSKSITTGAGDYTFKSTATFHDGRVLEASKVVRIDNTGPVVKFDGTGGAALLQLPKTTVTTISVIRDTSATGAPAPDGVRFFREVLGELTSLGTDTTSPYTADVDVSDLLIGYPVTIKAVAYTGTKEGITTQACVVVEPNEAPTDITIDSTSVAESADGEADSQRVVGSLSAADPNAGQSHTFEVLSHTDKFDAIGTALVAKADSGLNFEGTKTYNVNIRASDNGAPVLTFDKTLTITVTNVNEAPVSVTLPITTLAEDAPLGTSLGALSAVDPEVGVLSGHSVSFAITSDTFRLHGGNVVTQRTLDHENAGSPTMEVIATDNGSPPKSASFFITVTVTDVNEAPSGITLSNSQIAENVEGGAVGTFTAADEDDGQSHSWTLTDDAGVFRMVGNELRVKAGVSLDYETQPAFTVRVKATDDGSPPKSIERSFSIEVTNVAESPSPRNTAMTVAENSPRNTAVGSILFEGAMPEDVAFTIVSGDNDGIFRIQSCSGQIFVERSILDFETAPNVYTLGVDVTTENTVTVTATITVTNVNERPDIAAEFTISVPEDAAGVVHNGPTGFDPDTGGQHTWTISDGNVGSAFAIDPNSGNLIIQNALNFEGLASYTLFLIVEDQGGLDDTQLLTINVQDVNEKPTISSTSRTVTENTVAGTAIEPRYDAFDEDGDDVTFEITGGNPGNVFAFAASSGTPAVQTLLQVASPPDHEAKNVYNLQVRAVDEHGLASATATITVTVTDVNEAPVLSGETYTFSVNENSAPDTVVAADLGVTDPDDGATFTYALDTDQNACGSCTPGSLSFFSVTSGGSIIVIQAPDFEAKSSHVVMFTVTDNGGMQDSAVVTININDLNEKPVMPTGFAFEIKENSADQQPVTDADGFGQELEVCAGDEDTGQSLTYTMTGGQGRFELVAVGNCAQIVGKGNLDFEDALGATFTLAVTSTDDGTPAMSDTANIIVHVRDQNDAPTIASATRRVGENSVAGNPVGDAIVASDQDAGDSLAFSITGGNTDNAFRIEAVAGTHVAQIYVADGVPARLQDLSVSTWTLTVAVDDGEASPVAGTVTITLVAENDPPHPNDVTVSIQENSAVGTQLTAMTYTDQENDAVTWSIVSGNDGNAFAIDSTSGIITVSRNILDFEGASPSYSLTVKAVDSPTDAATALSGTATVSVTVTNQNEDPVLGLQPGFSLNENLAANQDVGAPMTATDPDSAADDGHGGSFSAFTYALTTSNVPFSINAATGQLRLTQAVLDFESRTEYSLALQVTDGGGKTATGSVTITINDLNEQPSMTAQTRSVDENAPAGTAVGAIIPVVDDDSGQAHAFSIVGDSENAFAIDSNGQVTVAKSDNLDFERKSQYALTVRAEDPGGLVATADLTININDLNEAPAFTSASVGDRTVNENVDVGTLVGGVVVGTDVDAGDSLTYSLPTGETTFAIHSTSGQITVRAAVLDFETTNSYLLDVTVQDAAGLESKVTLNVYVQDVPEAPVAAFHGDVLTVDEEVPEDTFIGTIVGTDVDAGTVLTYALASPSNDFKVDAATGNILVGSNRLNYEDRTSYTFDVIVSDNTAGGAKTDQGTITISVNDVNERPVWDDAPGDPPAMTRSVPENKPVKTTVGVPLPASDVDEGQLLLYSIVGGNEDGVFAINPCSGQVTVAKAVLNHEVTPTYVLTIHLQDDAGLSVEQDAQLTIQVTDVDEAPVAHAAAFTVNENSPATTAIGTATSWDEDLVHTASYAIVSGDDDSGFAIAANTGAITVAANVFNFERRVRYDLVVRVTDDDGLTDEATIIVTVVDVNEPPVIIADARSIVENSDANTVVGTPVSFTDVDGNGVSFAIKAGTGDDKFLIDSQSGVVTLAPGSALDFETKAAYTITIVATDDGSAPETSELDVPITIVDENENPTLAGGTVTIKESTTTRAAADDRDSDIAGSAVGDNVGAALDGFDVDGDSLTYSIVSGDDLEQFRVSTDGNGDCQITVRTHTLDYEAKASYSLVIRATDNGLGALTADAAVTVNIEAVNEAPWILPTSRNIDENSADDTPAGAPVQGDDIDAGTTLSYSITGGTGSSVFKIDSASGQIAANGGVLDFETTPVLTLEVTVSDGELTGKAIITINLQNVNEAPVLSDIRLSTNEKATADTKVATPLVPVDVDSTSFTFSIIGDPESFKIDASTGQILVDDPTVVPEGLTPDANGLLRTFTLTVRVDDDGTPVKSDTATVTIDVFNQNDPPEAPDRFFNIDENSKVGDVVGSMPFTDKDDNRLSYTLTNGNVDDMFAIDPTSALITVRRPLIDFETRPKYEITVEARDDGPGEMTGNALATIIINDLNEDPVAVDTVMSVDENSPAGTRVGFVTASDVDSGDTLGLTWTIDLGNDDGAFRVDTTNGLGEIILIKDVLNFELQATRTLTMRATDPEGLFDTAIATITVNNKNDPPIVQYQVRDVDESEFQEVVVDSSVNLPVGGVITANDPDLADQLFYTMSFFSKNCWQRPDVRVAGSTPSYTFLPAPLENVGETDMTFKLTGDQWMLIGFSASRDDSGDMYEIVIGGTRDTDMFIGARRSSSRAGAKSFESYKNAVTFTSAEWTHEAAPASNDYWISMSNGGIAVGSGDRIGSNMLYVFDDDSTPLPVRYVGVSTVSSVTATFGFMCFETDGDTGRDVFSMDMSTGQLTVRKDISHEVREAYSFLVDVEDDGEGRLSASAVVEVRVTNVNEKPWFDDACPEDPLYRVCTAVEENAGVGTLVGAPIAIQDDDAADTHTYSILSGNIRGAFAIDSATGQLSVAADVLDFEDSLTAQQYVLTVGVVDQTGASNSTDVLVRITDQNEAPVIGNFARQLRENAAPGSQLWDAASEDRTREAGDVVTGSDVDGATAQDVGGGVFGQLTYSITGGERSENFAIDPTTGMLSVANGAVLDFEAGLTYWVEVQVTDGGGLMDTGRVDITLIDINEQPSVEDATRHVNEHVEIGTQVGDALVASDPDVDQNLYFSIVAGSGQGLFRIDPCSGKIFTNSLTLDFEIANQYTLTVIVEDDGLDPARLQSDPATVTINIDNVNEAPVLTATTMEVDENSAVDVQLELAGNAAVHALTPYDQDNDNTAGDWVPQVHTWEIEDESGMFKIDATTGALSVAATGLDFEATVEYTVVVIATDNGTPALSGNTTVTVQVRDRNENPVIMPQARSVAENVNIGKLVGSQLVATDPDVNSVDSNWRTYLFSITGGDDATMFNIEATTGQLSVARAALNHENKETYAVEVTVTDNGPGGLTGTATITVTITDVNEKPIVNDQTFVIDENSVVDTKVSSGGVDAAVVCTDVDRDQTRSYAMVVDGRRDSEVFYIEPLTGQIMVKIEELDFEATSQYTLTVRCIDAGLAPQLEDSATITIRVNNLNEEPVMYAYTRQIDENGATNVVATSQGESSAVTGFDQDTADTLSYSITGGSGASVFDIDSASGTLTLKSGSDLDFETTASYTVEVTATDDATPALSSTATTVINVIDLNEAPVLPATLQFNVPAFPEITDVINTVTAADEDRPADPLTYSITDGDGTFRIDPSTGVVSVAANVASFTTGTVFSRTVRVADDQNLADTTSVTITVTDANNKPDLQDAAFAIAENVGDGFVVGTMVFSDGLDQTVGGQKYVFSIKQDNRPFRVVWDETTVSIQVAGDGMIDHEAAAEYIFDVVVIDDHALPLSDEGRVVVTINDVNEAPTVGPVVDSFGNPLLRVDEDAWGNSPAGTVVGELSFADQDDGVWGEVTYSIAPEAGAPLGIRAKAGAAYIAEVYFTACTQQCVDFETDALLTFDVTVTDSEGESATKSGAVTVNNMNDPPTMNSFAFSVDEDAAEGLLLGTITGNDVDNTPLSFAIVGGDPDNHFSIDAANGQLTVASTAIDYERRQSYNLVIQGTDIAVGTDTTVHSATTTVPVTVVDVNDITIDSYFGANPHTTAGGEIVLIKGSNFGLFDPVGSVTVTYGPNTGEEFTATNCHVSAASIEINCTTAEGLGGALRWKVSVDGGFTRLSDSAVVTSYKAPVITALSDNVVDMPTIGGTTVTLQGTDFGASIEEVTVTYFSAGRTYLARDCAFVTPHTELTCVTEAGVGTNLQWTIRVRDLVSEPAEHPSVSSYADPVVDRVVVLDATLTTLDTAGRNAVQIFGSNFGAASLEGFNALSVTYGPAGSEERYTAASCRVAPDSNDGKLQCVTVAGVGGNHAWKVHVGEQKSAVNPAANTTSYTPPSITSIGGKGAYDATTRGGEALYITGSMFGPSVVPAGTAAMRVRYGRTGFEFEAQNCRVDSEHAAIACVTAEGTGKDHLWTVEVDGQLSALFQSDTSYANPIISFYAGDFYQQLATPGAEVVVVHGANFGLASFGNAIHMTYGPTGREFNASLCNITVPHETIECFSTVGAGRAHKWEVTIDGQVSEAPTTSYGLPNITSLSGVGGSSPHEFSTYGGEVVEIRGSNFGPQSLLPPHEFLESVTYGASGREYTATDCVVNSHSLITCRTVPGSGADLTWIVTIEGQESEINRQHTTSYKAPALLTTDTTGGATNGGYVVTLEAQNLGLTDDATEVVVEIRGVGDQKIQLTPDAVTQGGSEDDPVTPGRKLDGTDTVSFTMVTGRGKAKQVVLVVRRADARDVERFSTPFWFDYDSPEVLRIVTRELPVENSLNVLMDVTVLGTSFGADPHEVRNATHLTSTTRVLVEYEDVNGQEQVDVLDTFKEWSHDSINFIRNDGGTVVIETTSLMADGTYETHRTEPITYDFFSPSLSALTGAEAVPPIPPIIANGTGRVRINGRNLWSEGVPTAVTLGGENGGVEASDVSRGVIVLDNPDDRQSPNQWVEFTVPPFVGLHVPFIVFKMLQSGNDTVPLGSLPMYLDFEAPEIAHMSSDTGAEATATTEVMTAATDGTSVVTVRGRNFGFLGATMRFYRGNDFEDCTVTDTEMSCRVPEGEGRFLIGTQPYQIEVNVPRLRCNASNFDFGQCSPEVDDVFTQYAQQSQRWAFEYAAPQLQAITQDVTTAGATVKILGSNFGRLTNPTSPLVRLVRDGMADVVCTDATHTKVGGQEEIECKLPEGTGAGWELVVAVAGISSDGSTRRLADNAGRRLAGPSTTFKYATPELTSANVTTGSTAGGYFIGLSGDHLGAHFLSGAGVSSRGQVEIVREDGSILQVAVDYATHTLAVFTMPAGVGNVGIRVHLDGQTSNTIDFSYANPQMDAIVPSLIGTAGGDIITITGDSFGTAALAAGRTIVMVSFPERAQSFNTTDGPEQGTFPSFHVNCSVSAGSCVKGQNGCSIMKHTHTEMELCTPEGFGTDISVRLFIADKPSNTRLISYLPPSIRQVIPNIIDANTDTVTVVGDNFGPQSTKVELYFNDVLCGDATWLEGDERINSGRPYITCSVGRQTVGPKDVSLRVAFQQVLVNASESVAQTQCYKDYYGDVGEYCLPCPVGSDCAGFAAEPISQVGWYNMYTDDATQCDALRTHRAADAVTYEADIGSVAYDSLRTHAQLNDLAAFNAEKAAFPSLADATPSDLLGCNFLLPCEPQDACVGDNVCGVGYRDEGPTFRCSVCDDNYYRLAGECVECPDNPLLIVGAFIAVAICACIAGWLLNSKNVNVAFVSIGVDYFQVLALFANSRVQWPTMIKDLFHFFSIFNLNLELTAPECSIPDLGYMTKWFFIQGLPIVANVIFAFLYVTHYLYKKCILRRKRNLHRHASALIATTFVMFYYLYLYVTRTILDVFNCAPTDPPDGKEYLSVVFEPCWEAGGLQMTLLPFAFIALFAYSVGYPLLVFYVLKKNKELIMEDQLLRAKDKGDRRIENPHAYDVRKRYHKLYYHFRPDKWYWILVVIARKFGIAFTALMFNKNPAFQLSMALLVMFVSYAAQVKHQPYMSMSERSDVLKAHKERVRSSDPVAMRLEAKLLEVERAGRKATRRAVNLGSGNVNMYRRYQSNIDYCFNYNMVESVLLFSAVLVNLAGVMFESNRFETDYFQLQKDIITVAVLIIIFASCVYFVVVLVTEIYLMVKDANTKKALEEGKAPAGGKRRRRKDELTEEDLIVTDSGVNPMFAQDHQGLLAGNANMNSEELLSRNKKLLDEIQKLKKSAQEGESTGGGSARAMTGSARRRNHNKTEFGQVSTRARRGRGRRGGGRAGRAARRARGDAAAVKTKNPVTSASAAAAAAPPADDDIAAPKSPRPSTAAAEDSSAPLPAGWTTATHKQSGRTYYVNRATRETSWRRPTA